MNINVECLVIPPKYKKCLEMKGDDLIISEEDHDKYFALLKVIEKMRGFGLCSVEDIVLMMSFSHISKFKKRILSSLDREECLKVLDEMFSDARNNSFLLCDFKEYPTFHSEYLWFESGMMAKEGSTRRWLDCSRSK